MKVLIGSVFANDSPVNCRWLDLQLKYIKATTTDFDHVAMVMSGTGDALKSISTRVVPAINQSSLNPHLQGLMELRQLFCLHSDTYDNFLFLDSDAFPIKKNWVEVLLKSMKPDELLELCGALVPTYAKHYDIAVAVRSENLETRLHASVLFAKKEALQDLQFEFGVMGKDLLCAPEKDIHMPIYEIEKRHLALPLIRTNQYNVYPLACGIYYDMFYHHCCGSRSFSMRGNNYFSRIMPPSDVLQGLTERLFNSPTEFVNKLAGWNPSRYADVTNV